MDGVESLMWCRYRGSQLKQKICIMPTRESSDVVDEKREKYLLQNIRCKLKVMVYVVRPLCFCYAWRAAFNSLFIIRVITRLSTLATGGVPRGSDSTLNSGARLLHKRTQMLR